MDKGVKFRFPSPQQKTNFSNYVTPFLAQEFKNIIVSKKHRLVNARLKNRPQTSIQKKSYSFQNDKNYLNDPSFDSKGES